MPACLRPVLGDGRQDADTPGPGQHRCHGGFVPCVSLGEPSFDDKWFHIRLSTCSCCARLPGYLQSPSMWAWLTLPLSFPQIEAANAAFSPSEDELDLAHRVIDPLRLALLWHRNLAIFEDAVRPCEVASEWRPNQAQSIFTEIALPEHHTPAFVVLLSHTDVAAHWPCTGDRGARSCTPRRHRRGQLMPTMTLGLHTPFLGLIWSLWRERGCPSMSRIPCAVVPPFLSSVGAFDCYCNEYSQSHDCINND